MATVDGTKMGLSSMRPGGPNAVVWAPDLESGRFALLSREPQGSLGSWVEAEGEPGADAAGLAGTHRQRLLELARAVASDGQPREYEHEVRLTGGRQAWVRTELQRVTPALAGAAPRLLGASFDITPLRRAEAARRQAEEALQRSRAELDAVLRATPVGLTVVGASGERLYSNPEAARLTGYPDAETMRQAPVLALAQRLRAPDSNAPAFRPEENPALRALSGEEVAEEDLHYRLVESGEEFYVRVTSRAVRDAAGRPLFVVVTWQDLTALKRADEALRLQKSLLEAQSEATTEGVLVVSPEGRILSYNQQFARMWRLTEETLARRSDAAAVEAVQAQLLHPEDFRARVGFLSSHPEAKAHDELHLRDGRIFERYSLPLNGPSRPGAPPTLYGRAWFFRDITARKRTEERERTSLLEQTTRALSDAAAQRASFLSDASRLLSASLDAHAICEALARRCVPYLADWCVVDLVEPDGSASRAAVAHADPLQDELAQELREVVPDLGEQEGVGRVLRTGIPDVRTLTPGALERPGAWTPVGARTPEQVAVVRQLGVSSVLTLPLLAHGRVLGALTLVRSGGPLAYGALERELTEELAARTAMAVENAHLYQQSQQAVMLRDEFLSIAAHELRTPLTALELAVRSFRRAARAGRADSRRVQEVLDSVQRQARRLERLVESLLDVSRLQAGKLALEPRTQDLAAVVECVVATLREEAQRKDTPIQLHTSGPVMGTCDRALFEQVLTNLLDNAIKYGAGKPVTVSLTRRGGEAVLEVSDQGIGIPESAQARIFERFERAVSVSHYGGLGLGLYIAERAVERLGGSISVRSRPGQGSTFTVVLPLEGWAHEAAGGHGAPEGRGAPEEGGRA